MSNEAAGFKKPLSFEELINKYAIRIPIIQRDYAQGREDEKAQQVREAFLDSIFSVLSSDEPRTLELDFIYGVEKKDGGDSIFFEPIDGQQRLTTLFLLHYYFYDNPSELRDCFTYHTRISSKDFIYYLCGQKLALDKENTSKPSAVITNCGWFISGWKKDPSVKSMLTMLDAIHDKAKKCGKEPEYLRNNLCRLQFYLLLMDNFSQPADLYIKMNARGKALSHFENFKATLFARENSFERYDTQWLELIEKQRPKDDTEKDISKQIAGVELVLMNIFRAVMADFYALAVEKDTDKPASDILKKLLNNDDLAQQDYDNVLAAIYDDECKNGFVQAIEYILGEPGFNCLKNVADVIRKEFGQEHAPDAWPLANDFNLLDNICKKPTYKDRLRFYALYSIKSQDKNSSVADADLADWLRVICNITENRNIDGDNYHRAIKAIRKLTPVEGSILKKIDGNSFELDFFKVFKAQIEEEQRKARLILHDNVGPNWKNAIIWAETHPYLRGKVGFLLHWVGMHEKDSEPNSDGTTLKNFTRYTEQLYELFDKDGLKLEYDKAYIPDEKDPVKDKGSVDNAYLFRHALLTIRLNDKNVFSNDLEDDYLICHKNYERYKKQHKLARRSFCYNSSDEYSWKNLLHDCCYSDEKIKGKSCYVKELFDKCDCATLNESLKKNSNSFPAKNDNHDLYSTSGDWRTPFINNKKLFSFYTLVKDSTRFKEDKKRLATIWRIDIFTDGRQTRMVVKDRGHWATCASYAFYIDDIIHKPLQYFVKKEFGDEKNILSHNHNGVYIHAYPLAAGKFQMQIAHWPKGDNPKAYFDELVGWICKKSGKQPDNAGENDEFKAVTLDDQACELLFLKTSEGTRLEIKACKTEFMSLLGKIDAFLAGLQLSQ